MSLSFEDSLKKNMATASLKTESIAVASMDNMADNTVADMGIADMSISDIGIMTLDETDGIAAYSGDDGNWYEHPDYVRYVDIFGKNIFSDENLSVIDNKKNISLNELQFNITQEENSQYIPFEMPRYYDGYDLKNTVISIHYETSNGNHGATKPVNVDYNNEKIRFGWLVNAGATADAGRLKFEIHAYGTVTGNDGKAVGYVWKSKTNENLNVLQSLCDCEEVINKVDDKSWITELVTDITEKIAQEIAGIEVGAQVKAAEDAAARAESAASNAESTVMNALVGYATEQFVKGEIEKIDVTDQLKDYATTKYVDDAVASVDVSEQLNDYVTITGLEEKGYATEDFVGQAIAEADISSKLENYYTKSETYSSSEIDTKLGSVTVDLTGYATEKYVDDKVSPLSSSIDTNTSGISSLGTVVRELQETVNSIDTSPRLTYDIFYNDPEDENSLENKLVFYEIENEGKENQVKTKKKEYKIVGGGGGSASSNKLYIYFDKDQDDNNISQYVFTAENVRDNKAVIYFDFSGTDSVGDSISSANGTWEIRRGTSGQWTAITTGTIYPNVDIEFNVSKHISSIGTYQLKLTATDDSGGFASKTWTVQHMDFKIDTSFDDKIKQPMGAVQFPYTPYGAISKDVHFILDGTEIGTVTTSSSGIQLPFEIPAQEHGSHLLEVYMTAEINGSPIPPSNRILKDIIWFDNESTIPVIGTIYQNFTVKQYETVNIEYSVYDPTTETPTVEIAVDDVVVSTKKLDKSTDIYSFKTDIIGEHIITITCGETVKTIKANITKLDINVAPVTVGLAFDFNPVGKSNNSASDRVWSDGDVTMSVSDNFDWVNGGYQIDENGDQYFCVKSGTSAVINYHLFADDAKTNGKEFKVIFKTANIKKRDTSFISCMNSNIGIDMKVENARVYSSNNNLYSPYCEEDIIEFEFNINKMADIPLVMTYEDGVGNRPMIYTPDASFWQTNPQPITIGSENCDVYIYRMKAYTRSLSDSDILSNFIMDARNADEMIKRYNRNKIYESTDENGARVLSTKGTLTPESIAESCPDLRVIMIDAPRFTYDKDDKVDNTTIKMIHTNGEYPFNNWTCTGARHSGQGTSSNEYGYAGRNIDLIMDGDDASFILGDGTSSKTISLAKDSVPTDYLNVKVNIASSENQNNAQMARRYNMYNPFKRSAKFNDNKVKDCMEFYNCVIFVRENDENISNHKEFKDTEYHFYGIGNVGDSKKTDDTRVNDKNDPRECVVEIVDYNVPLAEFPTGKEGNAICPVEEWTSGNTAYDLLYADYVYKADEKTGELKFKSFGSKSYEFRYEMKKITEEQREVNINAWRDMYKFIVTSLDEDFHNRLKEYFVVDSALYYYLFTERYTMVDNRAKNLFFHYGKVYITDEEAEVLGEKSGGFIINNEQANINDGYRWDLSFGYDFDRTMSK